MPHDKATFEKMDFPTYWEIPEGCSGRILIGGLNPESYYLLNFESHSIQHCVIETFTYQEAMTHFFEHQGVRVDDLPYGIDDIAKMPIEFVQPHEGIQLKDGRIAFALNNASFIRIIDFEKEVISAFPNDTGFVPRMLSATNTTFTNSSKLLYSSSNFAQRLQGYRNPSQNINTEVKVHDFERGVTSTICSVPTSEGIHEISISRDGHYAFLVEFRVESKFRFQKRGHIKINQLFMESYHHAGLYPSKVTCVDLVSGKVISSLDFADTPGHVKQSRVREDVFYVSCHNASKAYGKIFLHGPGRIAKIRNHDGNMTYEKSYTDDALFRVTSHIVFGYQGANFVAVTGYPNKIYLLEDDSLSLIKVIELFPYHKIPTDRIYACEYYDNIPLWLESSQDGRFLFIFSNRYFYIYDVDKDHLNGYAGYSELSSSFFVTGHLKNLDRAKSDP